MKIHITGKYQKADHLWTVELPALNVKITSEKPFQAFKKLISEIEKEFEDPINCEIVIQDRGIFELTTMDRDAVYSYIARTVSNSKDLESILNSIKLKPDI